MRDFVEPVAQQDPMQVLCIEELSGALSEKDVQLSKLSGALSEKEIHVRAILKSQSWRLTAPIRAVCDLWTAVRGLFTRDAE